MRDDGGLAQGGSDGVGGRRLDSEYFVKEEPAAFADRSCMENERKRGPWITPGSLVRGAVLIDIFVIS